MSLDEPKILSAIKKRSVKSYAALFLRQALENIRQSKHIVMRKQVCPVSLQSYRKVHWARYYPQLRH